jgi:PAS domain S-box-containing protein
MDRAVELLAELRSYLGLTDADAELLRRLKPFAEPRFPAIADEFYAIIRMHQGAFSVFKDEAQARRLHASLQLWLGDLLSGTYDPAYVERRAHIGETHVRVGLQIRYMVTAMSRIRSALKLVADDAFADDPPTAARARLAVGRVCDLDLAIMLESYKNDFSARLEAVQARERDALRAQLDERRRHFLDAVEAADVLILAFDARGQLVLANRKVEELTGYSDQELGVGETFATLFGARAAELKAHWATAKPGSPSEIEADVHTRTGKSRIVRWHASTNPGSSDGPTLVVVGLDVTRERELERRARKNERLAAAGALAAGLAHEVRNPLNGINLHVSVLDRALARMPGVPDSARESTQVLRSEIKRLSALVTDFLEVARPRPLARDARDLNVIAREVIALLQPEAASRKASLEVEPFPFPALAEIDVERIKQVLVNLVRNGLEAVGDGGHVTVRVRRLPRDVEIDVADDGPGIPDPQSPVFDAFFTTKEKGTGLGLSIVHRIAADHGGDVTFASQPGNTVFTVRLPAELAPP